MVQGPQNLQIEVDHTYEYWRRRESAVLRRCTRVETEKRRSRRDKKGVSGCEKNGRRQQEAGCSQQLDPSPAPETAEERRLEKGAAEGVVTAEATGDCRLQEGTGRRSAPDAE